jgi:hypothetical protein
MFVALAGAENTLRASLDRQAGSKRWRAARMLPSATLSSSCRQQVQSHTHSIKMSVHGPCNTWELPQTTPDADVSYVDNT